MNTPTLSPTRGPTAADELDESAMYYSIALAIALVPASVIAIKSRFNSSYLPCMLAEQLERFSTNNEATIMSFIIPLMYVMGNPPPHRPIDPSTHRPTTSLTHRP